MTYFKYNFRYFKRYEQKKLNVEVEIFVPSFTRTKLTDALGKTYGITLSKSLIRGKILKKFKLFATKFLNETLKKAMIIAFFIFRCKSQENVQN